jgi:hypothetical protein
MNYEQTSKILYANSDGSINMIPLVTSYINTIPSQNTINLQQKEICIPNQNNLLNTHLNNLHDDTSQQVFQMVIPMDVDIIELNTPLTNYYLNKYDLPPSHLEYQQQTYFDLSQYEFQPSQQ